MKRTMLLETFFQEGSTVLDRELGVHVSSSLSLHKPFLSFKFPAIVP
ncbi:hypothetical protein GF324_08850 [bacterium]|nr:hypothetical protein [bacterium]